MKKLIPCLLLFAAVAAAQTPPPETFPGIKAVMTPEDFARSGLSALTPDQLGLIDAAIIRHYTRTVKTAATQQANQIVQQTQAANEAALAERKQSFLSKFGIPDFGSDWQDLPSLKAKCTGWVSGNAFKLDNGQVWEGFEPITVDVEGKDIEIQARPGGQFCLYVDGENTTLRVHRIK
ncbi:MAG: hypothetical protein JSR48_15165 [Verrucomicrobia bacterium]|nr:hypothetical protein [Verrucomicrobiota bacterium]